MKILYIHSAYRTNDLIGNWFAKTRDYCRSTGGDAWFAIKFTHRQVQDEDIIIGNSFSCFIHNLLYQKFGLQDMASYLSTKRFLRQVDKLKPDIIHCHVVNDCFLNMKLFANYVNEHNIKVVWTFHDARVLTGQCPCPCYNGCVQWQDKCVRCPEGDKFLYPEKTIVNMVSVVHKFRKKTIGAIRNLTVTTPSKWMASLVKRSYLKDKRCVVINNGINLDVFRPSDNDIRNKLGIPKDAKLLLAVGNPIGKLKGKEYLIRLAHELPENHDLVMVGCLKEDVEVLNKMDRVHAFKRVDRDELIAFYSSADLFVNPTLADNFPTVCIEAQACGCPIVAFDSDGTTETIAPKGKVVPRGNYEAMYDAIVNFKYKGAREDAIDFAQHYNQNECIKKYVELYKTL